MDGDIMTMSCSYQIVPCIHYKTSVIMLFVSSSVDIFFKCKSMHVCTNSDIIMHQPSNLSYGHMGSMRPRKNFAAESREVTWRCGCGSLWQRGCGPGCGNIFVRFAARTAPQCTPCDTPVETLPIKNVTRHADSGKKTVHVTSSLSKERSPR